MSGQVLDDKLNTIADNILLFFPFFYRKILRVSHARSRVNPINMQFHVLSMLMTQGILPTSAIGRRLGISKPNVTSLVDRLIDQGYAERRPDISDRRVINIVVTEKGKRFILNRKRQARGSIKRNLSVLQPAEIENLSLALETFSNIISKIGNGK
ncbi:MAG: MarR family transcriptional regulator [Chloroflexi bacterium]|nr:MarR family transcriptional regulator [Chloroflexota bacterium]